jgi:hypothetical protein
MTSRFTKTARFAYLILFGFFFAGIIAQVYDGVKDTMQPELASLWLREKGSAE